MSGCGPDALPEVHFVHCGGCTAAGGCRCIAARALGPPPLQNRCFLYIQHLKNPKLIELSGPLVELRQVRCNNGTWHGTWRRTNDPIGLLIQWHYSGVHSLARDHQFRDVEGTHGFQVMCIDPEHHAVLVPYTGCPCEWVPLDSARE